jgi:hypothetical protein
MSAGIIVVIVVAVIVVVAVAAGVAYSARRRRLRQHYGPEYDRLVEQGKSRRQAEAELAAREKRVRGMDIRPLDPAARSRYAGEWASIQERFVDAPQQAVGSAQRLVMAVMTERGYPAEGNGQVVANLSVDHAGVLDHYRAAYDISQAAADDRATTEDLRQAMIHYRALFQDLLGPEPGATEVPGEAGVARDARIAEGTQVADEPAGAGELPDAEEAGVAGVAGADVPQERRR